MYYTRAVLKANVSNGNFYFFMDVLINGVLPLMRKSSLRFYFVNEKIILSISDLSFFASTKLGRFFYVENVLDKVLFQFRLMEYDIFSYLNLFKLNK